MVQILDLDLPNQSGLNFRLNSNQRARALASMNAGPDEPAAAAVEPYTWWFETDAQIVWLRNKDNNLWLKFAEVTASLFNLWTNGVKAPATNLSNIWTLAQIIKLAAAAGELRIGSDLTTGAVGRVSLFGTNAAAEEVIGAELVARLISATDGSENFEVGISVMRNGALSEIMTVGDVTTFVQAVAVPSLTVGGQDLATLIQQVATNAAVFAQVVTTPDSTVTLNFNTHRSLDLVIRANCNLAFTNIATQTGRIGVISLFNDQGSDFVVTLTGGNVKGDFQENDQITVKAGQTVFMLAHPQNANDLLLARFGASILESSANPDETHVTLGSGQVSGTGFADRSHPIADGETQEVIVHHIQAGETVAGTFFLGIGVGSATDEYDDANSYVGQSAPADSGQIRCMALVPIPQPATNGAAFGRILIRREGNQVVASSHLTAFGFTSGNQHLQGSQVANGLYFGGLTPTHWAFVGRQGGVPLARPALATGAHYTIIRNVNS